MAPKRSNKGKEKMESDASVFKVPGISSISTRVAFSRKIEVLVCPRADVDNFESLFKITRRTFNYIRTLVSEHMLHGYTSYSFSDRIVMRLNDQIAIALARLSSVDTSINIATTFETNDMTVNAVTWEFVEALEQCAVKRISWPEDIAVMKMRFESISGMPNCYGAIDTTHLKFYPQKKERKTNPWLDCNNNNSMQLQVVVDPTMRFVDVAAGLPGSMTKDRVLQESGIFTLAQKGEKLNGTGIVLSERTKIPEYLVGDSGFQLLPWLITPYPGEELTEDQAEFNQKHLATRSVASRALKKLKDVWAVIDGGVWWPNRHRLPRIILACCILHNIQIEMEREGDNDNDNYHDHNHGYPPQKSGLPDDQTAVVVRGELCVYLAGKLPFYIEDS